MHQDQPPDRRELSCTDDWDFFYDEERQGEHGDEAFVRPPASYRRAYGDQPIRVGLIEFRIMALLASKPYTAFTRRQIAEAVDPQGSHVLEESVDAFVASLREQLGVLHDFVQTVPYVGYRFKA